MWRRLCEVFPQSVIQLDVHLQKTGLCERNFCEVKCVDSCEKESSRGSCTQSDKAPQGMSLETNIRLHRRQKTAQKTRKIFWWSVKKKAEASLCASGFDFEGTRTCCIVGDVRIRL